MIRKANLKTSILNTLICLILVIKSYYSYAEPVDTSPVSVSWKTLEKITFESYEAVKEDGYKFSHNKAIYPEKISVLDGKIIFMSGYLYPYELEGDENTFFWVPYPMTCPYHSGLSPSLFSAITFEQPVKHTYEKITVMGRLELSPKSHWGIYYSLKEASILLR